MLLHRSGGIVQFALLSQRLLSLRSQCFDVTFPIEHVFNSREMKRKGSQDCRGCSALPCLASQQYSCSLAISFSSLRTTSWLHLEGQLRPGARSSVLRFGVELAWRYSTAPHSLSRATVLVERSPPNRSAYPKGVHSSISSGRS